MDQLSTVGVEALQTRRIILMRMFAISLVGALSFLLGAYLIAAAISVQGPEMLYNFGDIGRGVFLILMSAIIIALGKIYEVLVEIRDK